MSRVVDEFHINQYSVLKLDKIPNKEYSKFIIKSKVFEPVPIYDMPQCIAIASSESYLGETVEFV